MSFAHRIAFLLALAAAPFAASAQPAYPAKPIRKYARLMKQAGVAID